MKKIYILISTFIILILTSSSVFAAEDENEKRKNAFIKALDSYMQTFMTEETPEEDRIVDYIYTGFGIDYDSDKLKTSISFYVKPVNENNTTWSTHENICFATFSKVDDEYVLDKISRYPDNYDKFLERFEEYKKDNPTTVESTQIQSEELPNNLAEQEIEKMSNIIFIGCSVVLLIVVCFIITKYRKNRK